jgi:hypothetical protein
MLFFILVSLLSIHAFSQNFFEDTEAITHFMGRNELDRYMSGDRKDGINGSYLLSFKPQFNLDLASSCLKEKQKESRYELILVSSFNNQPTTMTKMATQLNYFSKSELKWMYQYFSKNFIQATLNKDSVSQLAVDIWKSGYLATPSKEFNPNSYLGKDLITEGILYTASKSNLNEKDLARSIADTIAGIYTTDEEKYQALSKLSARLYLNYNNPRNPGSNNSTLNPDNKDLPPGDLSLNQMFSAASNFDPMGGGVCNDISESIIMIGQELFPNKDVLAVNSGTHFGVVLSSGKENRVIDGWYSYKMNHKLILDPTLSSTNLRLSNVTDGKLKEIAVVDTEMGQVVEKAFSTGKNLLKTDADISSLMAHLKKDHMTITAGSASLSDSKVLIVVAKYENISDKWRTYAGSGLSSQMFENQIETKYQFHLKAGAERNIVHFISPRSSLNVSTGFRLSGMYALGQPKAPNGSVSRIEMSGALDQYNRLDFNYGNQDRTGFQLRSSVEVEHTLGPTSWGELTGRLSSVESSDTIPVLKNMSFHLNQVNADVSAENKINQDVGYYANVHYQGSNIGQSLNLIAGITVQAPNDAEILIFTGYLNSDIKGFETQNSLLANPSGIQAGIQYKTKSGIQTSAKVRGIAGKESVEATIKVPLNRKRK